MMRRAASVQSTLAVALAALGLCMAMALAPSPARADDAGAKSFIETNIGKGIAILKDKSLTNAQQRDQVRALLSKLLDTRKIGLFSLGAARASASPDDLNAYIAAFNTFMVESYVTRLDGYGGQTIKITGVIDHAPGDYIVTAVLVDPSAPADPDPIKVMFRVLEEGDHYAVVDASIAGVWLGLAQRDDFVGFLGQHGNSVPTLTAHLKEMTAKFDAPPKAAAAQ